MVGYGWVTLGTVGFGSPARFANAARTVRARFAYVTRTVRARHRYVTHTVRVRFAHAFRRVLLFRLLWLRFLPALRPLALARFAGALPVAFADRYQAARVLFPIVNALAVQETRLLQRLYEFLRALFGKIRAIGDGSVIHLAQIAVGRVVQRLSLIHILVNDIFMPLLSVLTGKIDFSTLYIPLDGKEYASYQAAVDANAAMFRYGRCV